MNEKLTKKHGRLEINKLDWLLAIISCLVAIDSLWISLGISIANAGGSTPESFLIFLRGISFQWGASYSQANGIAVCAGLLFYIPLLVLVIGAIVFVKKELKFRVPGLVAQFVGFLGISVLCCFVFEFTSGSAAGAVRPFWPWSLLVLLCITGLVSLLSLYVTFRLSFDVSLNRNDSDDEIDDTYLDEYDDGYEDYGEEKEEEEVPAEEPVEEVAPVEEAKKEEPVEEAKEEEPVAEAKEEVDEVEEKPAPEDAFEEEAEQGDKFSQLGPRRKRIPFENKVKYAKPETKARYKMIVSALRLYQFNDRKSIPCETFSYKKRKMVVLTFAGKTLKVFLRLDPKQFAESPLPIVDASEVVKYQDTPSLLVVKSDLAARRVIKLAEQIVEEFGIPSK